MASLSESTPEMFVFNSQFSGRSSWIVGIKENTKKYQNTKQSYFQIGYKTDHVYQIQEDQIN